MKIITSPSTSGFPPPGTAGRLHNAHPNTKRHQTTRAIISAFFSTAILLIAHHFNNSNTAEASPTSLPAASSWDPSAHYYDYIYSNIPHGSSSSGWQNKHDENNPYAKHSHGFGPFSRETRENKKNRNLNGGAFSSGSVQLHLSPASSWIRWLEIEMESIDSQLENISTFKSSGVSNEGMPGGIEKEHHNYLLRRLENQPFLQQASPGDSRFPKEEDEEDGPTASSTSTASMEMEELQQRKETLQQHLQHAINSMKGTGAAYASVVEFELPSSLSDFDPGFDEVITHHQHDHHHHHQQHHRHLRDSLQKHNNVIQEYNDYHRQYSKYEWALREGRGDDNENNNHYEGEEEEVVEYGENNLDRNRYKRYLKHRRSTDGGFIPKYYDDESNDKRKRGFWPEERIEVDTTTTSTTASSSSSTSTKSTTSQTTTITSPDATINPLIGTTWKSIEIAPLPPKKSPLQISSSTTTTDPTVTTTTTTAKDKTKLHPTLPDHPITITFTSSGRMVGETGCNNFHSSVTFESPAPLSLSMPSSSSTSSSSTLSTSTAENTNDANDSNSFIVGFIATTRMYCSGEGIMDQENEFVSLFAHRRFQYEIVDVSMDYGKDGDGEGGGSNEAESAGVELILREINVDDQEGGEGREVLGDVVARFAKVVEQPIQMDSSYTTTTSAKTTTTIETTNSSTEENFPLSETSWKAAEIAYKILSPNDPSGEATYELRPMLDDFQITLIFSDTNDISGTAGCNSYEGNVIPMEESSQFQTGMIAMTEMYCSGDGVMEQEGAYGSLLSGATFSYDIIKNDEDGTEELVLRQSGIDGSEGVVLARFVGMSDAPIQKSTTYSTTSSTATTTTADTNAGGDFPLRGTSWKAAEIAYKTSSLSSLNGPSEEATYELRPALDDFPVTLIFSDRNSLSGQAGCNGYGGDVTPMESSQFQVGLLMTTMMYCMDDGVMEQERAYTSSLSEALISYEIIRRNRDELVLRQPSTEGNQGEVLARFVGMSKSDDVRSPGDRLEDTDRALSSTDSSFLKRLLPGSIQKSGGMFNNYQTSPVFQGYGTHYATIWVGTPPQRKTVIVDTGSHFTAFPCKGCLDCGEEHHTDKYFDPDASSTFRELTCGECHDAKCLGKRCIFSQVYTEGSSWHAYESVDKVFLSGRELNSVMSPLNAAFTADFLFGCQTKETGLFVTQLADGIMGMSAHPSTLPRAMYDKGKLEHNMFSMCFKRELHVSKQGVVAGFITLGGIDSRVDLTPMVYARNVAKSGWFTVFVKGVYVRANGGQSVRPDHRNQKLQRVTVDLFEFNSGKGVIVDSGTTDTYLHKSVAEPFDEVWREVTGRSYTHNPVKISKKDLLLLPTVLIQLAAYDSTPDPINHKLETTPGLVGEIDPTSPQDILIAIPATHYMEYSPSRGTYTPRIYFTESQGGVIGSNAMQGHNVLFDWENKRVGFAESTCEYQENNPQTEEEVSMLVDCKLGAPSLSLSCSDSVDLSQCDKESNAEKTLSGNEIWTRIVQSPGTSTGLTCEAVSVAENDRSGGGKMDVHCDGKGICREQRECQITCANAIALGSAGGGLSKVPESPTVSCGGGTWSACDYTCSQTRINVVYMSDGQCHEEKGLEFTRPCHVHACGREDPCRVPFVIHAIIKIRGAIADLWTKKSEEMFAEAFAATVNGKRGPDDVLFGPGDVIVVRASTWKASDDNIFGDTPDDESLDEELGMQLVVETSIANYNAILASNQVVEETVARVDRRVRGPKYICDESDLQPLAAIALDIHRQLAQPNFVPMMLDAIKRDETDEQMGRVQISPFFYTFDDPNNAKQSRVLTSWTIKTDIGGGETSPDTDVITYSSGTSPMLLLTLSATAIFGYLVLSARRKKPDSSNGSPSRGGSRRSLDSRSRGKYSRIRSGGDDANTFYGDDSSVMAVGDGNVLKNDQPPLEAELPKNYDYSIGSIGSLSTYLERTRKF